MREEIFARQQAMGLVPHDTVLTPRPDVLAAWDSLSTDEKKISARFMESWNVRPWRSSMRPQLACTLASA